MVGGPDGGEDTPLSESGFVTGLDRLLRERAEGAASAAADDQEPWEHGGHVLLAIILAVASIEAHVGEWLGEADNRKHFTAAELKKFRRQAGYEVAKSIICKRHRSYDFNDCEWYRRLNALYELRNHVAHYYPEKRNTGTFPKDLNQYLRIFETAGDDSMDWTSRLIVRRNAEVALEIVDESWSQFDAVVDGW